MSAARGEHSALQLAAPGKLFLAGEYAVLEPGRDALVIAVDRKLHLSLQLAQVSGAEPLAALSHRPTGASLQGSISTDPKAPIRWQGEIPGELRFAARAAELALRLCAEEGLPPRGFHATFEDDLELDLKEDLKIVLKKNLKNDLKNDLKRNLPSGTDRNPLAKPGLGGSAAASVLAIRATCLAQQRQLSSFEAMTLAAAAHWVEQRGSGSGADVAAAALGGALAVRRSCVPASAEALWSQSARSLLSAPLVETRPLQIPAELKLLAVWSGAPADTRVLVRETRAFATAKPERFHARIGQIALAAESLEAALGAAGRDRSGTDSREAILGSVRDAAAAMAALGDEAGCPIVTPALAEICAVASAAGAAGKPSGAGGGDCALVFAFGDEARARTKELLRLRGFASAEVSVSL